MPNDIYRWEKGGGLIHHCPVCKTPLTHAKSRSRCLGEHVEWCSRYHTQLFRKNWSSECAPCRHSDEQHHQRHREIAELLRQLTAIDGKNSPEKLKIANGALIEQASTSTPPSSTKKERKAAKKAAKLAELPKVVSMADVEFVAKTLHPHDFEKNEADEERKLINDPDIKLNLYFHRATCNTRENRHRLIKCKDSGEEPDVQETELDALLVALNVQVTGARSDEKALVVAIRAAVRDDLINVEKERQQTIIRKGGFWRWASRKAHDRLVANGRVWEDKHDENTPLGSKDIAVSIGHDSIDERMTNGPGGKDSDCRPSEATTTETTILCTALKDPADAMATDDDGWTIVGRARTTPQAMDAGSLKLSANGGLRQFNIKPTEKFSAWAYAMADED